jgi:excisionase family DNA binding protein
MSRPTTKTARTAGKGSKSNPVSQGSSPVGEVLTLAEVAAYLRISPPDVLRLVEEQGLPGRKVGCEWRFLKAAVAGWLSSADRGSFWQTHFGALKDDPYLADIVRAAYRHRGRLE